jgi:sortase A
VIRFLSSITIALGVVVLLDAAVTLVWQEPVTAVIAMIRHDQIDKRYLSYRTAPLSRRDQRALAKLEAPGRIAFLARHEERELHAGAAVGRIIIPKIGVNFLFVQGTGEGSLASGPGHYPSTALPGMNQTVAIAGHRTTYLAPFRHLDALRRGDLIILKMPYGRFDYRVQFTRVVTPNAWWITHDLGYDRVVLSACNPVYSAAQRIAVFAKLAHA